MRPGTLPVSEVYGPVHQGEGPATGRRCSFLRLMLCNLSCSWCDTPFTWDTKRFDLREETTHLTASEIHDTLLTHHTDLLVLTGGEPLLHQNSPTLLTLMALWEGTVHVETNGTLVPERWLLQRVDHFSVSPKLANGGDAFNRRRNAEALWAFRRSGKAIFKFVCATPADVAEVTTLLPPGTSPGNVWIMPEGITPGEVLATAAIIEPAVLRAGYNLTLRQHTLIHGNERGR